MPLPGPIVVVSAKPVGGLVHALGRAGAFPVIESRWPDCANALTSIKPAAVVMVQPDGTDAETLQALADTISGGEPWTPVVVRAREDAAVVYENGLWVAAEAPVERLIARLSSAVRIRTLHATVLRRARILRAERGIVAELPNDDPLNEATVLVAGRGRFHPMLSVAVGERMAMMGALSLESTARILNARDVEGVLIGDGFSLRAVETFLAALARDPRFRDLPIGVLGAGLGHGPDSLANFITANDPGLLVMRTVPLIRLRSLAARLSRLLRSIERKGMIDPQSGLLTVEAYGQDLTRAIEEAAERGGALCVARFVFDDIADRRRSLDSARIASRLMRNVDFGCLLDDGSILTTFTETDLRTAHVVARRIASALKHAMLHPPGSPPPLAPDVTLAALRPGDTLLTLMGRVAPRAVAAE